MNPMIEMQFSFTNKFADTWRWKYDFYMHFFIATLIIKFSHDRSIFLDYLECIFSYSEALIVENKNSLLKNEACK